MLKDILEENSRRLARFSAPFNPITGEGSIGPRSLLEIPDFTLPRQFVPSEMLNVPLVAQVAKAGSIAAFLRRLAKKHPDRARAIADDPAAAARSVSQRLIRIRFKFDFPFWAASIVKIKNKDGGDDVRFRLRYPQRRLVSFFEEKRRAAQPIRLILLKARQWGGSTTTQVYMAWLQLFHQRGLNSLIIAHQGSASDEIKDMFDRLISNYPDEFLCPDPLCPPPSGAPAAPKLEGVGHSGSTQRIPARNCKIKIGTAERPDGCRGGDYSLVHLSEVGIWKKTEGKSPEDIVRSACSGILLRPLTMIVMESTANGTGNFFHSEYAAAADPLIPSQFSALFIPWFDIEQYSAPFPSDEARADFAKALLTNRNNDNIPSARQDSGRYIYSLWERGASLEAINWYILERAGKNSHAVMASEFPSDDIEAFVHSGSMVFDRYLVKEFEAACRPPQLVGEVAADALEGRDALRNPRFVSDSQGSLYVWDLPDDAVPSQSNPGSFSLRQSNEYVTNRYLVVVDIGGRSASADFSVILVLDRVNMLDGDRPTVVAQWYGHSDIDRLAWRAAQIAAFYDNALLVIESNTLETHDPNRQIEGGDQSLYILNQIAGVYPNLYARRQSEDEIRQGIPRKYGFHTNIATKPMIISNLIKVVREHLYTERDIRALNEFYVYERKPNGSYGAIIGRHDDLLMTRAIALHICFNEMPAPTIAARRRISPSKNKGPVSEASF